MVYHSLVGRHEPHWQDMSVNRNRQNCWAKMTYKKRVKPVAVPPNQRKSGQYARFCGPLAPALEGCVVIQNALLVAAAAGRRMADDSSKGFRIAR